MRFLFLLPILTLVTLITILVILFFRTRVKIYTRGVYNIILISNYILGIRVIGIGGNNSNNNNKLGIIRFWTSFFGLFI